MKSRTELALLLRDLVSGARHHYSPGVSTLRSIIVTPDELREILHAADELEKPCNAADQ